MDCIEITDDMVERAARAWEPTTFQMEDADCQADALTDARRALTAALTRKGQD